MPAPSFITPMESMLKDKCEYDYYLYQTDEFSTKKTSRILHVNLDESGDLNENIIVLIFTIRNQNNKWKIQSEGAQRMNPGDMVPLRNKAIQLAKDKGWKFLPVAIAGEDAEEDVITKYVVVIESYTYGNETVYDLSKELQALRTKGLPDFYRTEISVEGKKYSLAFVKRERFMDYLTIFDDRPYRMEEKANNNLPKENMKFTPEWFKEKSKEYPHLDEEASQLLEEFYSRFSTDDITSISGKELLNKIFLNQENPDNLCRVLEYDSKNKELFGSIAGGAAIKYGLYYGTDGEWTTGTTRKLVKIGENDAIDLGTEIRDYLIAGADTINEFGELTSIDDYKALYETLKTVTHGYVDKAWFMKYYYVLFPELFASVYTDSAQRTVLIALGLKQEKDPLARMGQIKLFTDECEISNVMFNKIFWDHYYAANDTNNETILDEDDILATRFGLPQIPKRTRTMHPLNCILYGAPGTGKTYSTAQYALAIVENKDLETVKNESRLDVMKRYNQLINDGQVVFTTFHQNYGYEDFIQGVRPDVSSGEMAFRTVDGVFKIIADRALNNPDKDYVLVIDEINRANISKVFGELITLIENDKRWGEENAVSVTLPSGDQFAVPNNLYIVGTMNSADKSISLIDTALRRRFEFIEFVPDLSLIKDSLLRGVLERLNKEIANELGSTDLLVGHSYFIERTKNDLCDIMNRNIIPLLYEYFFDNQKKVENQVNKAIEGTSTKIESGGVGRIRIVKKGD